MSWLGNGFREKAQALSDAYASMYAKEEEVLEEGKKSPEDKLKMLARLMQQAKDPHADTTIKREAFELWVETQIEEGVDFSGASDEEVTEYFLNEVLAENEAVETAKDFAHGAFKGKKIASKAPAHAKAANAVGRGLNKMVTGPAKAVSKAADAGAHGLAKAAKNVSTFINKEEAEILDSLQDAYAMMYEKKKDSDKCGEDTYWDKEEKKCKSKKKSSKTVVVGRGGIYGPGYHGGGGGTGGDNGGDGETDGGDGGDGGGDGGGGGE